MKKIVRYLLYFLVVLVVMLLVFIEIITLIDYKPESEIVLAKNDGVGCVNDTVTIVSWNIGYAGLGAEMDFFYDGGRKMRASKEQTKKNLEAITNWFKQNDSVDIVFIQEIDLKSHRSYRINQLDIISEALSKHVFYFAKNYDVWFVPIPIFNPMGRVEAGIATLSKAVTSSAIRHAYPSQGKWPVRLFLLDNCFLSTRYPLKGGKELVLINTHNSAYDDGKQRLTEMEYVKQFMLNEYGKGNYVIAGGDWNQLPPLPDSLLMFDVNKSKLNTKYFIPKAISVDFMPSGWQWISDGLATNRFLNEPYVKGKTAETLIDFFLVSPNVRCISKKAIDLNFKHSDHNPIIGRFVML